VRAACSHLDQIQDVSPNTRGCEECLKMGGRWVHLRMCLTCGHVGCCDSSPNRHATKHFHSVDHPIIQSIEPGEDWRWCYADDMEV
jgi:uncharacterized UBP type Zn finger protein